MPYVKHKPMPNEQGERNDTICKWYSRNGTTFKEIATFYEISSQRVHQIVKRDRHNMWKKQTVVPLSFIMKSLDNGTCPKH